MNMRYWALVLALLVGCVGGRSKTSLRPGS